MTRHLTPEELVDLAEGTLSPGRAAHADGCRHCREEADEIDVLAAEARRLTVPEPSPLFWRHLSERIAAGRASSRASHSEGWQWWGMRTVTAAVVAALLVVAVVVGLPLRERPREDQTVAGVRDDAVINRAPIGTGQGPAPTDEPAWDLLLTVADTVEWKDGESDRWLVDPSTVEGAVSRLSAAERRDLVRFLEAELEENSL